MVDEKPGEIVSFEDASLPHVHARKEAKLKKIQKAFKDITADKLKSDRKQSRKRKNSKKKKR